MKLTRRGVWPSIFLAVVGAAVLPAQTARKATPAVSKASPDVAHVRYGPHERNVLDLWQAKTAGPRPLVVYIHGGGFRGGDKSNVPAGLLRGLLAQGISVMAINYRLSPEVIFPAHHLDAVRAIQWARSKAREWNLDPTRFGASGGSAGAGISLWIGFQDDMAEPRSADPVSRESTRLTCLAVTGAQSTYDPRKIREWVSDAAARHPALDGLFGANDENRNTPVLHRRYEAASAINLLTRDDPPVYAFYNETRTIAPDAKAGANIHHINFGVRLKERMDALGIECTVRHRDEGAEADREMTAFFVRHLLGTAAKGAK